MVNYLLQVYYDGMCKGHNVGYIAVKFSNLKALERFMYEFMIMGSSNDIMNTPEFRLYAGCYENDGEYHDITTSVHREVMEMIRKKKYEKG